MACVFACFSVGVIGTWLGSLVGLAELGIVILNDQILPAFQKIAEAKEIHVEVIDRKPYCLHYHRHYHLEKDLSQEV